MKRNTTLLKRLSATALALALAVSLAACAGGNSAETPEDVLKKAQESMADIKSMRYDMNMDIEMTVQEQAFPMTTTMQADYIVDPLSMKMDMTMDMGELGSISTTSYMVTENGTSTMYNGTQGQDGATVWAKQELADLSSLQQYDAKASFDLYLSCAESFTKNGTETISGKETTRYDGVISKDAMDKVLQTSGMLDQMDKLGLDSDVSAMLSDLADLPISIWVTNDTYVPMKYEMDMTTMMQNMMSKMMAADPETANIGLEMNKVFLSMTLSGINDVDAIQVPAEALAAK